MNLARLLVLAAFTTSAACATTTTLPAGGVASLDDIYALKQIEAFGVDSVIVGKALYEGVFTLEEVLDAAESDNEP